MEDFLAEEPDGWIDLNDKKRKKYIDREVAKNVSELI